MSRCPPVGAAKADTDRPRALATPAFGSPAWLCGWLPVVALGGRSRLRLPGGRDVWSPASSSSAGRVCWRSSKATCRTTSAAMAASAAGSGRDPCCAPASPSCMPGPCLSLSPPPSPVPPRPRSACCLRDPAESGASGTLRWALFAALTGLNARCCGRVAGAAGSAPCASSCPST